MFFKKVVRGIFFLVSMVMINPHLGTSQTTFENVLKNKLDSLTSAQGLEMLSGPILPNNSIQCIMTPSGWGGNGSYLFGVIGGVYPALYTQKADLITALGFCVGNSAKHVNVSVSVNMTRVRALKDLSLNMGISRRIFRGSSITVGGMQLFANANVSDAPGSTFFVAFSHSVQVLKSKTEGYSPLTYTIGVGNGRFLLKSPYDVKHGKGKYGTGVFGSVSYEILRDININAEWSGLNLGFSAGIRPFHSPVSVGIGIYNLTKYSGDKPMAIVSMGYPIALSRRGHLMRKGK